jgi:hypothetical protein
VVRDLVEKVMISEDRITIRMRRGPLSAGDLLSFATENQTETGVEATAAVGLRRRGIETK